MIEVKRPSDSVVIEMLEGFLAGEYSRQEIYQWLDGVQAEYGLPVSGAVSDADVDSSAAAYILPSLRFILDRRIVPGEDEYFLREADIKEYIAELKSEPFAPRRGDIQQLRAHELPRHSLDIYQVSLSYSPGILEKFEVPFYRGVIDSLGEYNEYAILSYKGASFFINYAYQLPGRAIHISGYEGQPCVLSELLAVLGFRLSEVEHINKEVFSEATGLWRLDDNDNEFLIETFDNPLEAELMRKEYEDRGHKQVYFLRPAS